MLQVIIPTTEYWDEKKQEFVYAKGATIQIEHSLVSVSKWESKWHKSFLSPKNQKNRTKEEFCDYVRCMTLTQNVDPEVYKILTQANIKAIHEYMNDRMSATYITSSSESQHGGDTQTAEVIYWQMLTCGIPFECQKWHLNRLLTLIEVCARKNGPGKRMSKSDIMRRNSQINSARRRKYHTRG